MSLLAIKSFREISEMLLGELSPSMSFLYDLFAVVFALLFVFSVLSVFVYFFKRCVRW